MRRFRLIRLLVVNAPPVACEMRRFAHREAVLQTVSGSFEVVISHGSPLLHGITVLVEYGVSVFVILRESLAYRPSRLIPRIDSVRRHAISVSEIVLSKVAAIDMRQSFGDSVKLRICRRWRCFVINPSSVPKILFKVFRYVYHYQCIKVV